MEKREKMTDMIRLSEYGDEYPGINCPQVAMKTETVTICPGLKKKAVS